ncbi:MAG: hypothetical protein HPY57_15275 [Ignavibacteria bacterium]|nr:hypothetical protein [Ignavibacteria bacterium]
MKLLIKFPTRGRVDRFFNVLDRYYAFLDDEDNTEFCISIDIDDKTMNNQKVIDRLSTYKNLKYYVGNNKNKIEAVNADIDKCQFDIVLLASDDMIPQLKGYDNIIRENMKKYYPDTDGVLWFFDGNRKDLNTLSIMGKKYFDRFGYLYKPGYKSFYCDNEFMLVAEKLGKQTYIDICIIKHEHPDIPKYRDKMDLLYAINHKYYPEDYQFFMQRKQRNFDIHLLKK